MTLPPENVTTPSLEALQAYSLSYQTQGVKRDYAAAVPLLQRAISLDPNFAMAYARLGTITAIWAKLLVPPKMLARLTNCANALVSAKSSTSFRTTNITPPATWKSRAGRMNCGLRPIHAR